MNLFEAKQLLKKRGYRLIKEDRKLYEAVTFTPEEIFDDLWDRKFSYWDDSEYDEFKQAFIAGYTGGDYNGSSDAKYAYDDGIDFSACDTNQSVEDLLAELTSDEWYGLGESIYGKSSHGRLLKEGGRFDDFTLEEYKSTVADHLRRMGKQPDVAQQLVMSYAEDIEDAYANEIDCVDVAEEIMYSEK